MPTYIVNAPQWQCQLWFDLLTPIAINVLEYWFYVPPCTNEAAVHWWCRRAPVMLLCISGAAVHRWCRRAPVVPPNTGGAAMHHWCHCAPVVLLCTGGAAVHHWCHRALVVPLCSGGAAVHRWCCRAPISRVIWKEFFGTNQWCCYALVVLLSIADDTLQWQC